ncbi:hypothetical protein M422DRAFT_154596 [Sphaerobolus stellatus SS14]|nr:hypothetical protein M422DRAFT_154596 [Sphaerobolus stellatus SS14]
MSSTLPSPSASQAYVDVSVLDTGHLFLSEVDIFGDPSGKDVEYPSMSFLLRHSKLNEYILFDLGLRKDWENYTPEVAEEAKTAFHPRVPTDVIDCLAQGGLDPSQVKFILFSHIHFDHVGNPALFPSSTFLVGGEAEELLSNGYSTCAHGPVHYPSYAKDLLPQDRTIYLSDSTPNVKWLPVGPFPRTYDFFGDGSVYIVDSPGHMPGHINLLARTSLNDSWIYLAGDSVHDVRLLRDEKPMGDYIDEKGNHYCMHDDMGKATTHLKRIQELNKNRNVQVLISHDKEWFTENKDKGIMFPGKITPVLINT